MISKTRWVTYPLLSASLVTLASISGTVLAAPGVNVLNTRGAAGFSESTLGTSSTFTDTINRANCPAGQQLTQVQIEIFDVDLATRLQFQNITGNTDTVENTFTEHTNLRVALSASTTYAVGAAPINPANRYPPPAGGSNVFTCSIGPGQNQSQCSPTPLPVPMLETSYSDNTWTLTQADGAAFDFFKTGAAMPVTFNAGGRVQTNVPASWQTENTTPATGNIRITYTCQDIPQPNLVCETKTLTPSQLTGPSGSVVAFFSIRNTGNVNFTDLKITDTMSPQMVYDFANSPVSDPQGIGDPDVNTPPVYQWTGKSLAAGQRIQFSYEADISNLLEGQQACNTVVASASGDTVTSNSCRACVGRPPGEKDVPAIGPLGLTFLTMSLGGLGALVMRVRRRRSAR